MPRRLRRRVDALRTMTVPAVWGSAGPAVDPGGPHRSRAGLPGHERLEFTYTARGGERTTRHVEPHRLVSLGRRWYLVAYDLTRHDWRSFRLDRLDEPRSTGARFRSRELPTVDAATFVRAGIDNLSAPYTVEVLVHAPAAAVRDQVDSWGTVEDIDDGRCLLRMTSDSLDWPTMVLGAVGADFEVRSPPELLDYIRDWAHRFSRATAASGHG